MGENLIEGVKREIYEESGIEVSVGELFCVSSNTSSYPGYGGVKTVPPKVILDFICRFQKGSLGSSDETSESAWFPKNKALELITVPSNAERYKAFLEYTGRPVYLEYRTKPAFELKAKRLI